MCRIIGIRGFSIATIQCNSNLTYIKIVNTILNK
jgi:hypothetical protein